MRTTNIMLGGLLLLLGAPAQGANWLMLQGTEPADAADRAYVWGFIQVDYQKDYSDPNSAGAYVPPKLLGPNLTTQEGFNVSRARLGVRGAGFPLDNKVNYFLLTEFGNNGITAADGPRITDASITLNHLPGARLRAGLFKTPGPEEALQAIHVFDYVNFSTVTNQLMLERVPNARYTSNVPEVTLPVSSDSGLNQFDRSVAAFRDVGLQVFDTFNLGDWEHTYAIMVGNGNGLNFSDNDSQKDVYAYLSTAKVYGSSGPMRNDLKLFVWQHRGRRLLDNTDDAVYNPRYFDREREGLGFKYRRDAFRLSAEYMRGKGMIFVGPDKPTFDQNGAQPAADGADGEASGWYVEGGWRMPGSNWELDLRHDVYHRLEDDPGPPAGPNAGRSFESVWTTWTAGAQYYFNRKTRFTFNYAFRSVESPDWPDDVGPNDNMNGIDDVAALQLTHIF
jgi:hypothetical protein